MPVPTSPRGFVFLDHTADILVKTWGPNLAAAFEEAAIAMFDSMTDIEKVLPEVDQEINVSGHDKAELLYNWLEELLFIMDTQQLLFSEFKVEINDPSAEHSWRLHAHLRGELFKPERHVSKVGIKAITYSHFSLEDINNQIVIHFLLDI